MVSNTFTAVAEGAGITGIETHRHLGEKRYEIKDHLGNVRAVTSDIKNASNYDDVVDDWRFLADIRSLNNYYPYGSLIDEGSWSGNDYNFGYNGMLKEGIGKDIYNTHFRNLSGEGGRWWSPDPLEFKFPDVSPYLSMGGNPINFVDPMGDSLIVNTKELYKKDKKGNYVNMEEALSFELFLSSNEGKDYLLKFAQKGFKFEGVFNDVSINAQKNGEFHNKKIDLSFSANDLSNISAGGATYFNFKNGRWKINVFNDYKNSGYDWFDFGQVLIDETDTWSHETLLHVDLGVKNILNDMSPRYNDHHSNYKSSLYNNSCILILRNTNKLLYNLKPPLIEYGITDFDLLKYFIYPGILEGNQKLINEQMLKHKNIK